jgi:preprotein translocase subunit YajC
MTHLLATELLAKSGSGGGGGSPIGFLVIIVIFAVVYIVFLRPARSRSKKAAAQRNKAEVGDRVTTTAGLIATVVAIDDDEVTLEVAPGVYSQYLPAAILRVMDPPETYEHDGHDDLDDEADGDDASEVYGESEQPPVVDEPTDS